MLSSAAARTPPPAHLHDPDRKSDVNTQSSQTAVRGVLRTPSSRNEPDPAAMSE